jgi:hypothetical protein
MGCKCDFVAFREDLRLQSPIIIIFRDHACVRTTEQSRTIEYTRLEYRRKIRYFRRKIWYFWRKIRYRYGVEALLLLVSFEPGDRSTFRLAKSRCEEWMPVHS